MKMGRRYENIFYGLVTDENSTTELFCNLLQFKPFRDGILGLFLERDIIEKIDFDNCNTQKRLDNCGCPDLTISNSEIEILLEVKINNTGLTDNQPQGYLKHFEQPDIKYKKHKWLILLIPDDYYHREEWGKRMPVEITRETWLRRIPIVIPTSGINIYKIYWTQIIRTIEEYGLSNMSPYFSDFASILKKWFEKEPITFTYGEGRRMFSDEIPKVMRLLYKTVDNVREDLSREFGTQVNVRRIYSSNEEYGVNIENQEFFHFWFGIWYPSWEKYKKPLCYGIEEGFNSRILNVFKQSHQNKLAYDDGWYYSWIEENLFDDLNSQKNISSLIIEEIKALLSIVES